MDRSCFARGLLLAVLLGSLVVAKTQPATTAAATPPDAVRFVSELDDAYGKLKSLRAAGTLHVDINIAGQVQKDESSFTSSFSATGRYRHDMRDALLLGSDGRKAYALDRKANSYIQNEAPTGRVAVRELPFPAARVLQMQNPSLLLALSTNGLAEWLEGATDQVIQRGFRQGELEGDRLSFTTADGRKLVLLADPATHLLRQVEVDMADVFIKRGAPDVKAANIVIRYTQVQPGASLDEAAYAWTPPPGAREQRVTATGETISPLEGKPAPDFTLSDLTGKPQKLSDIRRQVVVLDFWATWCAPCVEALPQLDKFYRAKKDKGLTVLAINAQETKGDVEQFMKQQKLSLTALLDSEGKVAELYGVDGYPTTVIIGRDGKVRKVYAGLPPAGEEEILNTIEAILSEP